MVNSPPQPRPTSPAFTLVAAARRLALCLTVGLAASSHAELIPADRLVDWTPGVTVGVPGGIRTDRTRVIDVTTAPYHADRTGTTDATAAIQAAINAATAGDVVYLPAGTYLCNGSLSTGYKSEISVRGAGDSTILVSKANSTFIQIGGGSDYNWSWPPTGHVVTGGLAKGSKQITVADGSLYQVGQLLQLGMENNPATPVISVFGYQGMQRQMTRITGKSGNTLSIFPALYGDYSATRTVAKVAQFQANFTGLEHLVIDMSQSKATFAVWIQQAYGCWVKDVRIKKSANYHIFLNDSLQCEIRRCYLDQLNHTGSNGAGLLCNTVSGCLIEDNIIYKAFPLIEVNHGSCGNVFAYNFLEDSSPGVAIDSNHGPHNAYNLYEGNVSPNLQSDGYFGSASHDTLFRNWFHGVLNGSFGWTVSLNRFTRHYSIVGNIFHQEGYSLSGDGISMGNPNMGNGSYTGTAPPWTDGIRPGTGTLTQNGQNVSTTEPIFKSSDVGWFILTPATSLISWITAYRDPQNVTVNYSQNVSAVAYVVSPGPAGYQGLDTGVAATTLRKGNYYYASRSVPAAEALGAEALPASLFRSSKPAFFGTLAWPPFDPANPAPKPDAIPAGLRYATGVDPLPGTVTPTPIAGREQKPINVRITND